MSHPSINLNLFSSMNAVPQQILSGTLIESPTLRKKKSKIVTTRKTNQDLIYDSYQSLMAYIDKVDEQVQHIVSTYEAQFLGAYQVHIKKVREDMEQLKKRAHSSSHSQEAFMNKIDALQKQSVMFREESLKLFAKVTQKDKTIDQLNIKLQQTKNDNKFLENRVKTLTKKIKDLEVELEKSLNNQQLEAQPATINHSFKRDCRSENKMRQLASPKAINRTPFDLEQRPFTTTINSKGKSLALRLQSKQRTKDNHDAQISRIKQQISQKLGQADTVRVDAVMDIVQEQMSMSERQDPLSKMRKPRSSFVVKAQKRKASLRADSSLMLYQSQAMGDRKDVYETVRKAVEDVKKDIIRRNQIPSINFFKSNGPMSYVQFKKVDQFTLMGMIFKNEGVMKKFYEILLDTN